MLFILVELRIFTGFGKVTTKLDSRSKNRRSYFTEYFTEGKFIESFRNRQQENQSVFTKKEMKQTKLFMILGLSLAPLIPTVASTLSFSFTGTVVELDGNSTAILSLGETVSGNFYYSNNLTDSESWRSVVIWSRV